MKDCCSRRSVLLLMVIGLMLTGCGHAPTPFDRALDAGETARRNRDFSEERRSFDEALRQAATEAQAAEARYRRAHTWLREGRLRQGALELEKLATELPNSPRAARARLDAGRTHQKLENESDALNNYQIVFSHYPNSGGAISAAKQIVALRARRLPKGSEPQIWQGLIRDNRAPRLDEALRYQWAQSLEQSAPRQAIVAYEDVARRHPLPGGTHSDEALYRSAVLRRAHHDSKGALLSLEILVEQKSDAFFVGTYRRATYIKALYLKGVILRDDLGEIANARLSFRRLVEHYPESRLVDDALWQLAITSRLKNEDTCDELMELSEKRPHSHYLRCAPLFCPASAAEKDETSSYCRRMVDESTHFR